MYGGSIVYCLHKEIDALLSSGQSGVTFKRPEGTVLESATDTNVDANALWKIEASTLHWAGSAVDAANSRVSQNPQQYRLLHIASGSYLAYQSNRVCMTDEFMDDSCLWEFSPIDATDNHEVPLQYHSPCYIRHSVTARWVARAPKGNSSHDFIIECSNSLERSDAVMMLPTSSDACNTVIKIKVHSTQVGNASFLY